MKILVTGGAGYIGSHTCKALALQGHDIIVFDNLSTGHRDFGRYGDFVYGDIRDTQALRHVLRMHRPDGVIHFAAHSRVGESVEDPGKYFSNNVGGTLSLLEAMRDEDVHVIVVSGTAAVYGIPKIMPITETTPKNPINPYGVSKFFMERMLADFESAHGIKWMSLRYFNAAGCSSDAEIGELHNPETHLIPLVIAAALGKKSSIGVFGRNYPTRDGTCERDYIHVEDLARAHIMGIQHLLKNGESGALNLGTSHGSTVLEIIQGVEKICGHKIPVQNLPNRRGDPPCLVADATKAEQILGWKAEKPLPVILEDSYRFFSTR